MVKVNMIVCKWHCTSFQTTYHLPTKKNAGIQYSIKKEMEQDGGLNNPAGNRVAQWLSVGLVATIVAGFILDPKQFIQQRK